MKAQGAPFTGRKMLSVMIGFFATVLTANMTLVYFASHSWTGLVVKNAYVASQEFNTQTDALKQAAAGAHVRVAYERGFLSVRLTSDLEAAIYATSVTVKLGRPSHEGEDQEFNLQPRTAGEFVAAAHLAPGQWSGRISANITGHAGWNRPVYLMVRGKP